MNLPTVTIILEEHTLGRVYGASKVVHLVNSNIADLEKHISVDMTGRQINAIFKSLDYAEQMVIVELDVYNETESNILINQIELLNSASDSEGKMSETLRELIVTFGVTILFIIAVGVCVGYYENAKQNDAVMDSRLFGFIIEIIDRFIPGD